MYKRCMSKWENVCHSVGLLRFIIIIIIIIIIINFCSWFYLSILRPIQGNDHATEIYISEVPCSNFDQWIGYSSSDLTSFRQSIQAHSGKLPSELAIAASFLILVGTLWLSALILCSYIRISIVIKTTIINHLYSSSFPTERRDREGNTLTMNSGGSRFKSRLLELLCLLLLWFSALPPNKFLVYQIILRLLSSTSLLLLFHLISYAVTRSL